MKKIIFLIFISFLWGCSSQNKKQVPNKYRKLKNLTIYSATVKPEYNITFTKKASFGDTTGVVVGPRILSVAVDSKNRLYLADLPDKKIDVYNPDGSFLQRLGRAGRGPGEFHLLWKLRIRNHSLYALDYMLQKISVFNLKTMQHIRDDNISLYKVSNDQPPWYKNALKKHLFYQATNFYIQTNGNYIIFFSDNEVDSRSKLKNRLYEGITYSPHTEKYLKSEVFTFKWSGGVLNKNNMTMFNVPYKPKSVFDYYDGQLIYAWTQNFLLKFYNTKGVYQRAFYYSFPKVKFKLKELYTYYLNPDNQTKEAFRNDHLPAVWPAIHSFKIDDHNRIWVSSISDNIKMNKWRVFNQQGKLLAQFTWTQHQSLEAIKNGFVYFKKRNNKGEMQIVKYKFELKSL